MALRCENCQRGISYGHSVSHAKNRLGRKFKPNLQKLVVMKDGNETHVKLCSSCIKRMKKDGRIGSFMLRKYISKADTKAVAAALKITKKPETYKEKPASGTLDISSIVGEKK